MAILSSAAAVQHAQIHPIKLRPPLKVHGGKYYLARAIIQQLPQRASYCEPFAGGASVLLNLIPEHWNRRMLNDRDPKRVNLFTVIRDQLPAFLERLVGTEYTESVFQSAVARDGSRLLRLPIPPEQQLDIAVDYFIRMRMSRGGLGTAFAWSDRLRGGQPGDVNAWCTMRDGENGLREISRRLQDVEITCGDAIELLRKIGNDESFLCYLDPPYMHSTRTAKKAYGEYEISDLQHKELATVAGEARCTVAVSGYDNDDYARWYKNWTRVTWEMPVHAGQSSAKRYKTEVLWVNRIRSDQIPNTLLDTLGRGSCCDDSRS